MTVKTLTRRGHGLGLVPDAYDKRDRLFTAAPETTAYKFVDLAADPAMPPVWDQGQLGSCTAHGTLACFLFASNKNNVGDPMLSRLQQYYNTRKIEGTVSEDSGGQIRDAIKAAAQGVSPETDWPYDIAKFTVAPPAKAKTDAKANTALQYERVTVSRGAIQAVLSSGLPVDIGVNLDENSFESDAAMSTGLVPMPDNPDAGHCMAIAGVGTGADWHAHGQFLKAKLGKTTQYHKVRNSWGTSVYEGGYLLMPVTYTANPQLGSDYWKIDRVS